MAATVDMLTDDDDEYNAVPSYVKTPEEVIIYTKHFFNKKIRE